VLLRVKVRVDLSAVYFVITNRLLDIFARQMWVALADLFRIKPRSAVGANRVHCDACAADYRQSALNTRIARNSIE
jgi:hypothetical protein